MAKLIKMMLRFEISRIFGPHKTSLFALKKCGSLDSFFFSSPLRFIMVMLSFFFLFSSFLCGHALEIFPEYVIQSEDKRRMKVEADSKPLLADYYGGVPGFYHGVASGDPLSDRVIIWTRYTPVSADDEVDIELRMAEVDSKIPFAAHLDPSANRKLKRAVITVTNENDWVAKIDVTGLKSSKNYVFAFTDGVTSSIVGQTKTAPSTKASISALTYAVYSCAHFANGYFHGYDIGSTITDLDFWIHVGDYIVSSIH
jgi:PhoD-like phosphatase, N-terminal domain